MAAPSGVKRMLILPFACLPFPLAAKVICPDVVAAKDSFTDSRTSVSKFSPWNRDQRLFWSFPGSSQVGTTEISHLVDRIMDHTPPFFPRWAQVSILGQLRLLRFSLKDQGLGSQRFRGDLAIFIWSSLKRLWWNAVSLLVLFFRTEADRSRWLQSCHLQDLLGDDEITDV